MRFIGAKFGLAALLAAAAAELPGAPGRSAMAWEPVGLSGGGAMFSPAISPADPDRMMLNCDMSAAYISADGGRNWRMIHHDQLRSDIGCRPAFHPADPDCVYASSGGRLKRSRDGGRTFEAIGNLPESLAGEIAIHPDHPQRMLAGTRGGRCFRSADAGNTWSVCAGPSGQGIRFHFDRTGSGAAVFAASDKGIWRSDDGGQRWELKVQGLPRKELLGFAGGSDAAQNLTVMYCSVRSTVEDGKFHGGIYRSRDRGETWQGAMGTGLNVDTQRADEWSYGPVAQYAHLLVSDARPQTVYALNTSTGFHPPHHDTVYRSDDAGATWRATYFQDPRFKAYNVAPDYVTGSTGRSYKGGETPFGVAICNRDPDRLILVRNDPQVTHDGGKTWMACHTAAVPGERPQPRSAWVCNGLVVTTTWHYYVDPAETNRHYIAYTDIGMARSLDGGLTWRWWDPQSWAPWRNTCYEMAFDPAIPGKIWGAFSDVHDIPNDNIISERHGHQHPGGICVSRDFGASWKDEARGIPAKPVTSIVLDSGSAPKARTLYAGVFDEGVYKSTDDGATWTLKRTGLGEPENRRVYRVRLHADGTLFAIICAKRPAGGKPLMGAGVGLYRSNDGAETWSKVNASQAFLYPKDFSVDPRDSKRILVGTCDPNREEKSGGLYRTEDGGTTWERIGRQGPQTFGGYFHPQQAGWIYMTLTENAPGAGLWLSRDKGATWQSAADLPFANVQRVEFDPSNSAVLYVTTFGGSVWRGPADF